MFSHRTVSLLVVTMAVVWSWISGGFVPGGTGSGNFMERARPANDASDASAGSDAGWGMDPNG